MARVKGAMMARKRRNKTLKLAKGYWGAKSKHFKMANEQVMKSLTYAYVGRRLKKRDFRQLWITRISAACKMNGINANFAEFVLNEDELLAVIGFLDHFFDERRLASAEETGININFCHTGTPSSCIILLN